MNDEMFGLIEISETVGKNNKTVGKKKLLILDPALAVFYADFQSVEHAH